MKLSKIFVLASAVLALASCSNEAEWNTQEGTTVGLGKSTISVKESKGMFYVPVNVSGNCDAPVQVQVELTPVGNNPAEADKHYLVTSKTINISSEDKVAKVEIITVDDEAINEPRQFAVTIISAKGAAIDQANKTTTITLKDNDSEFYDKLSGKWKMTAINMITGQPESWNINIVAADEDSPYYNKYLFISGFSIQGVTATQAVLTYSYDMATNNGNVTFEMGQKFASGLNFGLGGLNDVILLSMSGNSLSLDPVVGAWSDDFKTITFQEKPIVGAVVDKEGSPLGSWFRYTNFKMER